MIILPQQKMDLLKCLISVVPTFSEAEQPIIATQDLYFGGTQLGYVIQLDNGQGRHLDAAQFLVVIPQCCLILLWPC